VQVDPIKPTLKTPGSKHLKLIHDKLLSNFAFDFNVCRYDTVGAAGPGLGYAGLKNSLAVEFDTWHNSVNDEPYERHVAVHTNGALANDAHHAARLASTVVGRCRLNLSNPL